MTLRRAAIFGTFTLLFGAIGTALADGPGGISSELERTATTTPAEKAAYADSSTAEIAEAVSTISTLFQSAAKDADIEAQQCLSGRLASAKALKQVSQRASADMKNAISDGNSERADHEFRKIAVAVSKTRTLLAEAQQCSADQTTEDGITNVTFFVEDDVVIGGEDGNDIDDIDIGFDPPDVSPF